MRMTGQKSNFSCGLGRFHVYKNNVKVYIYNDYFKI